MTSQTDLELDGGRAACCVSRPFGCATTARAPQCRRSRQRAEAERHHRAAERSGGERHRGAGESVVVTYAPDGHRSVFSRVLAGRARARAATATATGGPRTTRNSGWPRTWTRRPATCPRRAGRGTWPSPPTGSAPWTRCCAWGFVLLHDVPAEPGMVLEVAASFGFVRETNYGRLFDVRVEPRPGNLAFTSRAILPHTDNPYRDPVPTVQLLHCLRRRRATGGDTGLVDGFAAARGAARRGPRDRLTLLARTPVPFGYSDKEHRATGQPAAHPAQPARPGPGGPVQQPVGAAAAAAVRRGHRVLRGLPAVGRAAGAAGAAAEPAAGAGGLPDLRQHADPARPHGVQHDRGSPGRHLQGCYADLDGLASTLAVLEARGEP